MYGLRMPADLALLPSRHADIDSVREAFRVRSRDSVVSCLIAIAAWVLLRVWAYPAPYPGDATCLVAQFAGTALAPIYCPPLWAMLCRAAVRVLPSASAFAVVQAIAQICIAIAAGLVHATLVRLLLGLQTEESDTTRTPLACRLAATAAALLLLAFPPVWQAAQMPLPEALGFLLAALMARLAVTVAADDGLPPGAFLAFCAVSGAGLAESSVVLVIFPFAVLFLLTVSLGIERMGFDSELLQGSFGDALPPEPPPMAYDEPEDDGALGRAVLVPLGVLVGAAAAAACLLAALRINTAPSNPLGIRFSDLAAGIGAPLQAAFAEPTLRAAAVFFALPAIAIVAMARRQLTGDGGFVETLACALLSLALLTQTIRGGISAWLLSSSHAIQTALALPAAATFAICTAALIVRGLRAWRERFAPLDPDNRDDGWDDPTRPPPNHYTTIAAICLSLGALALILPLFLLLLNREPATRKTLATLDAYERDLAADIAPCRYFLSDGIHDVGLRLLDRDLLPIQSVSGAAFRKSRFRRDATIDDDLATSQLPAYERSLLHDLGWRALFNDWISFTPSNIASVAAQTGDECWQDLLRHGHPDWMPVRRGLVLCPPSLSDMSKPAAAAATWRQRLADLPAVPDPGLAAIVRDTIRTLDDLETLPAPPLREDELSPMESLGELRTAEECAAAAEHDPENLRARLCLAVHRAVDIAATEAPDAAAQTAALFDAIRDGAPPPSVRVCDLVQALVDIRLRRDPETAVERLEPYDYDEVLDPPFWYIWGLCGHAIKNEYNVMRAYEMIDKFPERRILRYELAAALARADGDFAAEIAATRSAISILPDDLFLLRRILAVQCLATPTDLAASAEHAERLLRRDARYPLAHIVYAARQLLALRNDGAGEEVPHETADTIIEHIVRTRRYLPPPHRRLDALVESLSAGSDPGLSEEGAYALVLDIARFCALPNTRERLLYETALLLQHHDPEAQNSRYLIDPMIELQRQLHPGAAKAP